MLEAAGVAVGGDWGMPLAVKPAMDVGRRRGRTTTTPKCRWKTLP